MKRWLIRCYPAAWRRRYGQELEELMSLSPAGWRTALDLFQGGMKMRLIRGSAVGLIVGFVAAGAVGALLLSYRITPQWRASTVASIAGTAGSADKTQLLEALEASKAKLMGRASLASMMLDPRLDLYPVERRTQRLETIEDRMRRDTSLLLASPALTKTASAILKLSFSYTNAGKASATTAALLEGLTRTLSPAYRVTILDPPSTPRDPSSPNRTRLMAIGSCAGLVLGLAALLARRPTGPPPLPDA